MDDRLRGIKNIVDKSILEITSSTPGVMPSMMKAISDIFFEVLDHEPIYRAFFFLLLKRIKNSKYSKLRGQDKQMLKRLKESSEERIKRTKAGRKFHRKVAEHLIENNVNINKEKLEEYRVI